jgi:hypothetical protein
MLKSNKIIKKLSLGLMVMLFGLVFVACGGTTTNTTNAPTTLVTQTTQEPVTFTTTEPEELSENTKIMLYDGPEILTSSDKVKVFVEDQEVFVYETRVNHGRTFTYTASSDTVPLSIFDFEGVVDVTIEVNTEEPITEAVIRPLAYGIEPTISGNKISFTLEYPTAYTIEYNGDSMTAVHLFANTIEEDPYDPNDLPDDVIYIGPGVYKADTIPVVSNQTIYIAGGAVVYGNIRTENMENITIKGRGIISGEIYPRTQASQYVIPIELRRSNNITIEGLTFLDPAGWAMAIYFSNNININNVNIITARANGDGISVQSSSDVTVRNSFLRTWDDALVVKNYDLGTTDNILFDNIQIWTDLAQSMEIGYETYGATMSDISFRNITVLHNFHKPVISIHNGDQAIITNVLFQNITVEDAQMIGDNAVENTDDYLIEFFTRYHQVWSRSTDVRGEINGVIVDNLKVIAGKEDFISLIHGFGPDNLTENIQLSNISIFGEVAEVGEDINLTTNDYVSNVTISNNKEVTGASLYIPYVFEQPVEDVPEIITVANIVQEGYLVPEFARAEPISSYMGNKVSADFTAATTKGTEILVYDDGTGYYDMPQNPSASVVDNDSQTLWMSQLFPEDPNHFYSLSINFGGNYSIGTIRLFGNMLSEIYQEQNIAVYGIRSTSTTDTYVKLLSTNNYQFTPASGNVVDIKIRSGEFKAIQLRFYSSDLPQVPNYAFLSEVEFYPASLSFSKPITSTAHEDVYQNSYSVDGNPLTYYEASKGVFPAEITVDLMAAYNIKYITLYLPPKWEDRTQEIEILVSLDGINYQTIVAKTAYQFLTSESNVVDIILAEATAAQYVKFKIYSNSTGYGAQISEISIFE